MVGPEDQHPQDEQAPARLGSDVLRTVVAMAWRLVMQGSNGFARFVTWVSLIGLALGVMVLVVVTSVMNGFDHELRQRILTSLPHITVQETDLPPATHLRLSNHPDVKSVGPYFQGLGAITTPGQVRPISLLALPLEDLRELDQIQRGMLRGDVAQLDAVRGGVLMGAPLARYLGLALGDNVLLSMTVAEGQTLRLRTLPFVLVGVFELGADPDYSLMIANLEYRERSEWELLGRLGTRIQLHDAMAVNRVVLDTADALAGFKFNTWQDSYGELFQAVKLEKSMMFVLLFLVVAIAAFNIIAGQSMMVNDKGSDIAILRTMGAGERFILLLFLLQGAYISVIGTSLGLALGILLASNVNTIIDVLALISGRHLLEGSYFVLVPVRILLSDLLLVAGLSTVLSLGAAWLPARRASRLEPAQYLH